MTDASTAASGDPTAEELAAAQAIMERQREADLRKLQATLPIVKEVVATAGFPEILSAAAAARGQIATGDPFYAHLNAMVLGMQNLQSDIAMMIVAAAPVAAPAPANPAA